MSAQSMKETARRWFEEGWAGKVDLADDFFAPNFSSSGNPAAGRQKSKDGALTRLAAFPDLRVVIDRQIVEGPWLSTFFTVEATHRDVYFGIPATNAKIKASGIAHWRFENGKVVESWPIFDELSVLRALGALPLL